MKTKKKITVILTESEAILLYKEICNRFMAKNFSSSELSDSVLHKLDAAFQEAGGE